MARLRKAVQQFKQNLLPDEMEENPVGSENAPWISPDDNIVTIQTPEGPRYIRDNRAWIQSSNGTPEDMNLRVNPEELTFDEGQTLGRMMPGGPPPPATRYATNLPGTADQWAREGKKFDFLADTPEETAQAKTKGYGKWGNVIGPPEASLEKPKTKKESPYPGQPPSDQDLTDQKDFDKFWNFRVQQNYGGNDPLKINPAEVRKAAEDPLKEGNAQFIYDYETYGPKQMGADSTLRYNRLQKQIKEAGDLAEEKTKNAYNMAHQDQSLALNFFKAHKKELAGQGKMTKEDQQELISIRQEKTGLRRDLHDTLLSKKDKQASSEHLKLLESREKQILKKEGGTQGQQARSIEKGLSYMKGITDKNEIMKRAQTLKNQYGWTREELNRLGQELGL